MKIFIFLLILAAFLQSVFIPIDLVLILLINRSLVLPEKQNLYAGFFVGLLVGLLQIQNLGFWVLVFLLVAKVSSLSKKLPFSKNVITILLINIAILTMVSFFSMVFLKTSFNSNNLIWESILSLPVYFLFLFWEERFVVKSEGRLKLRN